MATEPLVILGAGGFAYETLDVVDAINAVSPTWDILGFLVDAQYGATGTIVQDKPSLGSFLGLLIIPAFMLYVVWECQNIGRNLERLLAKWERGLHLRVTAKIAAWSFIIFCLVVSAFYPFPLHIKRNFATRLEVPR